MEDIFKQLGSYFQPENTIDNKTLDYCNSLHEIAGKIEAYSNVINWIHEPDLYQHILDEIKDLTLTSKQIQDEKQNSKI